MLERAQIVAEDQLITVDDLPDNIIAAPEASDDLGPLNLSRVERQTTVTALQQSKGNKVHAAKLLGISRRALYRLIDKYRLERASTSESTASA